MLCYLEKNMFVFQYIGFLKKFKKTLIAFAVLSALLQFIVPLEAEADKTVKVGLYHNKPLVFMDNNGKAKGIFVDILEHIAQKEQWTLEFVYGSWPECIDRLEAGEIDLIAAMAYSKERAKKYDFTYETVITNWGQVYVAKGSNISSVLDLDQKKIAVKMEDIHFLGIKELTSKFNMNCRFIEADGYDVVFELIEADRVQAGVVNRLYGIENKSNYPVQETSIMFNPIEVRFASPKDSGRDLLSVIDKHLHRMHDEKDPFYSQTLNHWLVAPSEWILPNPIKYTLIGIASLLFLFALTNLTLRFKVKKRTRELSTANVNLKNEVDIRMKAEEELRKYERIVASSTDHMVMVDLSYTYQAINDAALNVLKKSRTQVIGKKIWNIVGDIFPVEVHKKRLDRAFSGQVVKYRTWIHLPGRGRRYMDLVCTPYAHSGNQIAGCVIISRDITDLYELEKKLENAQKMEFMGTIAGGVAHDLNNILSGIVSYPDLLLMQLPEDSSLKKPIRTIKKSGEKAAVIVQDLLTLARRGVACKEHVDLNDIVTQFLASPECMKIKSFHKRVTIKTDLANSLKPISGSSVHLSKTVMNLVSNAAEAMPDGGQVIIKTENIQTGEVCLEDVDGVNNCECVLLEIADTGSGISKDDMEKIFEPFYTKKVMGRSGTGLGLAVVWGTIMDHHGHIHVESDGKNGSRFKLYFPASQDDDMSAIRRPDEIDFKGNGERILIVDDLDDQREIASNILSTLGYRVSAALSGEDAISYLRGDTADLVILDMLMPPGMDGLETFEEILKIRPGQKAVIASGFAETDRVKKALDIGVGQFIRKPYNIKDVGMAIRKELEK